MKTIAVTTVAKKSPLLNCGWTPAFSRPQFAAIEYDCEGFVK